MSGNSRRIALHFLPVRALDRPQHHGVINCPPLHPLPRPVRLRRPALAIGLLAAHTLAVAAAAPEADPGTALTDTVRAEVQRMAHDAALVLWGTAGQAPRVEVQVGQLPAQLKLAPCSQVVPYLPPGLQPLGRTRLGLRCAQGPTRWNVFLPVTVRLWAPSLVASGPLPAGTVLAARHLQTAEVDLAARADRAIGQPALAVGRTLRRSLGAGEALRLADLQVRQMFNTGDTVRIIGTGPGYAVSSEGQAMGPGLEGQPARVRTDSGRIITGVATARQQVEVAL